jgi:hypothetical protein
MTFRSAASVPQLTIARDSACKATMMAFQSRIDFLKEETAWGISLARLNLLKEGLKSSCTASFCLLSWHSFEIQSTGSVATFGRLSKLKTIPIIYNDSLTND